MRKFAAATTALFSLVLAGSAGAGLRVGVAEDTTAYADGGAAIYSTMHTTGMTAVRATVLWFESNPTEIRGVAAGRSGRAGAIAGGCTGQRAAWKHADGVVGATANSTRGSGYAFSATATEHISYTAGVYRVGGGALAKASGTSRAYWTLGVKLPYKLAHGTYVYRITMRAAMNPARVSVFTSKPFTR